MLEFVRYDTINCPYCNQKLNEVRLAEEIWKECIYCNKKFEIAIFSGLEAIHKMAGGQ